MKIKTWNNQTLDFNLPSEFAGRNLVAIPALIDPHVHFRTPGAEHKENWETGAKAAIFGGVTTVFDMPNNSPSTTNEETLKNKKQTINKQLSNINIPLNYFLYIGATGNNNEEIKKIKDQIIGIKMFMGSSTGNLLVDNKEKQEEIFKLAKELNLVLATHAEDEKSIKYKVESIKQPTIKDHSIIRSREAAIVAVKSALEMAKKYGTKLYICHVSTKEEIELIKQAKKDNIKVFAEVTPHHLFLSVNDYNSLGTLGQMNPPLRTTADNEALWEAIFDGTIDTIGTDHAPHTLEEKYKTYPNSPSGIPGLETMLPLLLNAKNQGKITLEKIVELTRTNIEKIFNTPQNNDWTIVDLDLNKEVKNEDLKTKCGWSSFAGINLKGWPVATVLNDKIFILN